MNKPSIALVQGDAAGIGPELMAKLLNEPAAVEAANIVIFGDRRLYRSGCDIAGCEPEVRLSSGLDDLDFSGGRPNLLDITCVDPNEVALSQISALSGAAVLRCFGQALDDGPEIAAAEQYPLYPDPINPLAREAIDDPLETGVGAVDGFLTVGKGQRMGIFAGSGVGKSTLLGMVSRNSTASVNVIALIGERGREVREFIDDNVGEAMHRCVVIASPADASPALRLRGACLDTELAEAYRKSGQQVLLLMDSLTPFAQA